MEWDTEMLLKFKILIAASSYSFWNTFSTSSITEIDIQQRVLHFYVRHSVFHLQFCSNIV